LRGAALATAVRMGARLGSSDLVTPEASETQFADATVFGDIPEDRASGVRPVEESAPQIIAGRYEVLGLLGKGGMGIVYRARDRALDEPIAIKVLHPSLARDAEARARLRHEVRLARRVTHRNVARTFDFGEHGNLTYLTMEAIEGESLARRIARDGIFSPARAVNIALDVALGLTAAHAAGVVHLDLKPDNILFGAGDRVVITDFGIAVAVEPTRGGSSGRIVGTPAYMAPEQLRTPDRLDARVDVYALGLVLYEMLTGRLPWDGKSDLELASRRLLDAPRDPRVLVPSLPSDLAELILASLAASPDERVPSTEAFRERLLQLSCAPTTSTAPPLRNAETQTLYDEARHVYHDFWRTAESVALFERVLAHCPRDPIILAGSSLSLSRATGMDVDTVAARRSARERAELAVGLAPSAPEAHVALAAAWIHEGDFSTSAIHLRRALDLAPRQPDALEHSARMLLETRALEDGITHATMAIEAEPSLREALETGVLRARALLGQWDAVGASFRERPERGGARLTYWLTRIRLALWKNDAEEKRRVKTELLADAFPHKTFPMLYARFLGSNAPDDIERQFLDDRTQSPTCSPRQRAFFLQLAAEIHALRGDSDAAIDALEAAVEHGLFDAAWIERCPALEPIRGLPRFADVRHDVIRRAAIVEQTLLRRSVRLY
jgi:serine/threonine-protein kinase